MNWRLVTEINAVVNSVDKKIWLFSTDKKESKWIKSLLRESSRNKEIQISDSSSIELSFTNKLRPSIKLQELGEDNWTLMNLSEEFLGDLFLHTTIVNGKVEGAKFETAFSKDHDGKVSLVCEGMESYQECFDEMIRSINCTNFRKTRKWIPGHRYDNEVSTLYYLGEFGSHKSSEFCSDFVSNTTKTAYLYTKDLKGCKSVSEVFKTQKYGKDIRAFYGSIPLMVDSGEVIKSDVTDPKVLWDDMEKNCTNLKDLLGIFTYHSGSIGEVKAEIKQRIIDLLREDIFKTLIVYCDTNFTPDQSKSILKDKKPLNENVESLRDLFWIELDCTNPMARNYYEGLMIELGIDSKKEFETALNSFDASLIQTDFDFYTKYAEKYYKFRDVSQTKKRIIQREKSNGPQRIPKVKLSDITAFPNLQQSIEDFISEIRLSENVDGLATYFRTVNIGTKSVRKAFHNLEFKIDGLIEYEKRRSGLTETLKDEIMKSKLRTIYVEIDEDKELE